MFSERFQLHSHALQYVLLAFTIIFLECYADDLVTNGTSTFNPQEILRYNAIVAERLQHDNASFVRKMSMDEGEKFWLGYWGFSEHEEGDGLSASFDTRYQARAAALVHSPILPSNDFHQRGLNIFGKRAFNCPSGTSSCSSIKRPTSCCGNGETCQIITDTGLGDVGCCPDGEVCSGEVSSCASGYTPCSPSIGGGCCIQGYECVTDGCAFVSTSTVLQSHTTVVESSTVVPPSAASSSATSISSTTESISTTNPVPPLRPTTSSTETLTSTSLILSPSPTTSTSISTPSGCPTGFYACSAVYLGGCCRTGRNCDTTSCPSSDSTTLFTSDGITIVAPTGPAAGFSTGSTTTGTSCPSGWFGCDAANGNGCCPSGFQCGSSCVASVSGRATATVAKKIMQNKGDKNWCLLRLGDLGWAESVVSILLLLGFLL